MTLVLIFILQSKAVKCPTSLPESPVHRNHRVSQNKSSSSHFATSAMKSDALGAVNKQGDGQASKEKNVKKSGEKSVAAKAKMASAATPVVNGTGSARAKRDVTSTNGPRGSHGVKGQETKLNPGARPKTCPPSRISTSQAAATKAQMISAGKAGKSTGTNQTQPSASASSDSTSPENGDGSLHNDAQSLPGLLSLLTSLCFLSVTDTDFHVVHHSSQTEVSELRLSPIRNKAHLY